MSTILKALRRLEDEKTLPIGERPLREEVARASEPTRRRHGVGVLMAGALVAGATLGAALLVVWPFGGEMPSQSIAARKVRLEAISRTEPPRSPERSASTVPPVAAAPRAVEPEGLSSDAFTSPVAVVKLREPAPLVAPDPEPSAKVMAVAEEAAQAAPEPAEPEVRARVAEPTAMSSPFAPPVSDVTEAPAAHSDALTESPAVVSAAEPPADAVGPRSPSPVTEEAALQSVEAIRVAQTLWHPTPARRVAVLDVPGRDTLLRVHEGDQVGEFLVAEIEPSGIVFTRDGETVRHAVGGAR